MQEESIERQGFSCCLFICVYTTSSESQIDARGRWNLLLRCSSVPLENWFFALGKSPADGQLAAEAKAASADQMITCTCDDQTWRRAARAEERPHARACDYRNVDACAWWMNGWIGNAWTDCEANGRKLAEKPLVTINQTYMYLPHNHTHTFVRPYMHRHTHV